MKLLEINALKVAFPISGQWMEVVRGIDLTLDKGEIVGLLGESGSGKSVTAAAVSLLSRDENARILADKLKFDAQDMMPLDEKGLRAYRGKRIAYVFQNPTEALSPLQKIGKQFAEVFKVHKEPYTQLMLSDLLYDVGLTDSELILNMYPHQLSGGQAQRVMVAMAIALRPDLIIADEPTSSIDASLKDMILDLLISINQKYGTAILVITHDFDVAIKMCQRVYILYGGLVMEEGPLKEVLETPRHPYTQELIRCVSSLQEGHGKLYALEGTALDPSEFSDTCPFFNRCSRGTSQCLTQIPALIQTGIRQCRCTSPIGQEGV